MQRLIGCVKPCGRLFGTIAIVLAGWNTQRVLGQDYRLPPSLEAAFQPDFVRRDLASFKTDLELNTDQQAVVQSLFDDYETGFRQGVEAVRTELAKLSPALGFEDPQAAQRRSDLRDQLRELLERSRAQAADPADADPNAAADRRRKLLADIQKIQEELRALNAAATQPAGDLAQIEAALDAQLKQWAARKAQLHDDLISGTLAALSEEQKQFWPNLERRLRREKTIGDGRLSGESVDLILLVRQVESIDRSAVGPMLNEYTQRLDVVLRERNEYISATEDELARALQNDDPRAAEAIAKRQAQLRVAVRNVNDEFANLLASKLPPEAAADLTEAYQTRGYGRVFRPTHTHRLLSAAKELPGLEPEVRTAVESIASSYAADLAVANQELMGVVRQHEPDELARLALRKWAQPTDPTSGDPIRDQLDRRNELGERYKQQLQAILPPEQFESLPGSDRARPPVPTSPVAPSPSEGG